MIFKAETTKIDNEVTLTRFSKGCGAPKVLLTAGLHGNEISGIAAVLKTFESIEPSQGTLTIIPAVNKLGVDAKTRNNPKDNKDLNRIFKEESPGPSKILMEKLVSLATNYELVIDFHNFFGAGYTTAFQLETGNKDVDNETNNLIEIFSPEIVRIQKNNNFRGGFVQELLRRGTRSFVVELPQQKVITRQEFEAITIGTKNVLAALGMLNQPETIHTPIFTETKGVKHKTAGIFFPAVKLGQRVKKGQKMGTITSLETLEQESVTAPMGGQVQTNPKIKYVREKEPLMSIGKKIG